MKKTDEYVSDTELLEEEDIVGMIKPIKETNRKKRACANCTCGRKETEQIEERKESAKTMQNAKSECGSCYLGDTFRCESCPYTGLPPFSPNDVVSFDSGEM